MLQSARGCLRGLSKTTKRIVLNLTMLTLLGLALLFIFLSTRPATQTESQSQLYPTYLSNYQSAYQQYQSSYRKYAFYQTYDDLIFNQKKLDDTYKQGLNDQYNLTQQQFQQLYTIVTAVARKKEYRQIAQFQDDYYYDWSEYFPAVKDMRDYDGGHIFSVVGLMEFQVNKKMYLQMQRLGQGQGRREWITLAQQEVIDCCETCRDKNSPYYVYQHLKDYGISRDKDYPYVSSVFKTEPGKCNTLGKEKDFKIRDALGNHSCPNLKTRLKSGPAVVKVDARNWREYSGGILNTCGNQKNHYALVVGRGIGYWKVRNSWGPLWGERGEIRLKSGNTCGICDHYTFIDFV